MANYTIEVKNHYGHQENITFYWSTRLDAVAEAFELLKELLETSEEQKSVVVREVDTFIAQYSIALEYEGTFGLVPGENEHTFTDWYEYPQDWEEKGYLDYGRV